VDLVTAIRDDLMVSEEEGVENVMFGWRVWK